MSTKKNPHVFLDVTIGEKPSGRMVFELFSDVVPKTVENFRAFCTGEQRIGETSTKPLHYKGSFFHRIVKDLLVQGGAFTSFDGSCEERICGSKFSDENFSLHHDERGTLSMVNDGYDSNSSQFFVTLKAAPQLDGKHVVFGRLVQGQTTLREIECVDTDNEKPIFPVKIAGCGELTESQISEVDAIRDECGSLSKSNHSLSIHLEASYCNGELDNYGSKFYGFPKRRKISAIRDFPTGCAAYDGKSCFIFEMSKKSSVPQESSVPKRTSHGDSSEYMNGTAKSSEQTKIEGNNKLQTAQFDKKNSIIDENMVMEHSEEEKSSAATMEKTKENTKASAELDKTNFQLQNTSFDTISFRSILYGSPKRRKISAVRDFPSGCGASITIIDKKQTIEINSSLNQKNLTVDKNPNDLGMPAVEQYISTGIAEKTEGTSGGNESKEPQQQTHQLLTEECKTANILQPEEKISEVRRLKEKPGIHVGGSTGKRRLKNLAKKSSGLIAGKLKKTEIKADSISNTKLAAKEQPLDVKPFRALPSSDKVENFEKDLGVENFSVKVCSSDKLIEEHGEKGSSSSMIRDKTEHNENVDVKTPLRNSFRETHEKVVRRNENPSVSLVTQHKKSLTIQSDNEIDIEALDEKVIVLGLMAEPNCPWRRGKGSAVVGRSSRASTEKSKKTKKVSKTLSSSGQLEIVPLNYDDEPLNIDTNLSIEDADDGDGAHSVSRKLSVTVPLHGLDVDGSTIEGEEVTRNRVRRTLRLFQVICRKLLQEEESKVKGEGKSRRFDLDAAKILKDKNQCVNTGKAILGPVPGVEVGDEFHFRCELSVIGLHRPYQGGIDYTKIGDKIVAISIVAGGNEDEMESSGLLTYSGSGGSPGSDGKPPEDQKLERGNLSLKNSIDAQTPVRVIRGSKEVKPDPRDGKPKPISTYAYDGLYMVEKYWKEKVQQGYFAFKFQLKRIQGQPELPIKEVKKSGKSMSRSGVCIKDISEGKEGKPICVVNTIDDERPLPFKYIKKIRYPSSCVHAPPRGCDCIDGCSDSENCACAVKNGGEIPFNHNGAIVQAKPLVYECGPSCRCPPSCYNRVSQHGVKVELEVFKTKMRGWGVRSLSSISSGSFICEYVGELLPDEEAERRSNDEYLFDIGNNYDDVSLWEGLPSIMASSNAIESVEDTGFTIDAGRYGNVGRFINHSCSPNLYAQNVLFDHDDRRMPHIMLFAAENIPPLQELTYHYNYTVGQVQDGDGNMKSKECHCGSHECTGRLY